MIYNIDHYHALLLVFCNHCYGSKKSKSILIFSAIKFFSNDDHKPVLKNHGIYSNTYNEGHRFSNMFDYSNM